MADNVALHMQPVEATVLPLRDDGHMKEYLLEKERRLAMVKEAGGRICPVTGTKCLDRLLADRTFICLHYICSPNGDLQPCSAQTDASGEQR